MIRPDPDITSPARQKPDPASDRLTSARSFSAKRFMSSRAPEQPTRQEATIQRTAKALPVDAGLIFGTCTNRDVVWGIPISDQCTPVRLAVARLPGRPAGKKVGCVLQRHS